MNENLTKIVLIIDKSGSMAFMRNDTIGGINAFIDDQKTNEGEATITTVMFDSKVSRLHDNIDIKNVEAITTNDYVPCGLTAMLDAIGSSIDSVDTEIASLANEDKPSKVIFFITTDGEENSSTVYSYSEIREMIHEKREKNNWEFLFVAANIDEHAVGEQLGVDKDRIAGYTQSSVGTKSVYSSLSRGVSTIRSGVQLDAQWASDIE